MKFDSEYLLFINRSEKLVYYYDFCGNLAKYVHIDTNKQNPNIHVYGIDQCDQIYGYGSDYLYMLTQ